MSGMYVALARMNIRIQGRCEYGNVMVSKVLASERMDRKAVKKEHERKVSERLTELG